MWTKSSWCCWRMIDRWMMNTNLCGHRTESRHPGTAVGVHLKRLLKVIEEAMKNQGSSFHPTLCQPQIGGVRLSKEVSQSRTKVTIGQRPLKRSLNMNDGHGVYGGNDGVRMYNVLRSSICF